MKLSIHHTSPQARESSMSRRQSLFLLGTGATTLALHPADLLGQVARHSITAHNRTSNGEQMAFFPAVLHIMPGESIRFNHADRGHNVQSFDGMQPEGASGFGGKINEEIEVTFDVEGTYGFFCRPHETMGMIGFVLVGDFTNNFEAVRLATAGLRGPMIARRVEEYVTEINQIGQSAELF